MKKIILPFFLLAVFFVAPETRTNAQEIGFSDSFDDPTLSEWERSPNVVVVDGLLEIPSGSFAFKGGQWDQLEITFRVKHPQGGEALFLYRESDVGAYVLRIGPDHVAFDRRLDAESIEMAAVPNTAGEWLNIKISALESMQQISVNGDDVIEFIDPAPLPAGGISLRFLGTGAGHFDDLVLVSKQTPQEEERLSEESPTIVPSIQSRSRVWNWTGGPPGGIGYDIRYNFNDPDIWYVTDANSGVYISTDNGFTWEPSNSGIPAQAGTTGDLIPIFSLTVDPHDPSIIWAGTQFTGHIYKSTDYGKSWTPMETGIKINYDALSFRGFTVDPRTSDIVYAMGETTYGEDETGGEIYKTVDGGQSWMIIWEGGMPSALTRYMWIDPRDPDILFVSTGIFDRGAISPEPNNNLIAGLGILKSIDGGLTWRELGRENGLEMLHIGSLFMHPEQPDTLLAGAGHLLNEQDGALIEHQGYSPAGVYRTTDGGETWTKVIQPPLTRINEVFSSVEFCISNPAIAYAGSDFAIYRSEDAGENWVLVSGGDQGWGSPGVMAGWPIDMQCDPMNTDRIFANNYGGGNFLSEDGGQTWQNASNGYSGAIVGYVVVDPKDPARVYASGRSGLWVSYTAGSTWLGLRPHVQQIHPLDQGALAIDPLNHEHLIAGGMPGNVMIQSFNGGQDWEYLWSPLEVGLHVDSFLSHAAITFAESDPNIVYSAASHDAATRTHGQYPIGLGVLVSEDGGKTWRQTGEAPLRELGVFDIAVDPLNAEAAYVVTGEGIFKTTDLGTSWKLLELNLDIHWVWTVAIDPFDSGTLIVGVEKLGAFVSHDSGETWQQGSAGWEVNGSPSKIVYHPTEPGIVFMGDMVAGVYQSSDGGLTWTKINDGLDVRSVVDIAISEDGQHLYAATGGKGVYRLDLSGQPPVSASVSTDKDGESINHSNELTSDEIAQETQPTKKSLTNSLVFLGVGIGLALVIGIAVGVAITRARK